MIKVLKSPQEMLEWRKSAKGSVGFVPTMGALHDGHASLLTRARGENENLVLSIFVNPTQFNNPDDLKTYPKTWEQDLALAQRLGVNAIFYPQFEDMYPDKYLYKISESSFSNELDGAHRPGHFDGVLTIVHKLLSLVQPQRAYFGEKDYQQLKLIQGMVQAFFLPVSIVPVPTMREDSGLAMSSRNLLLTEENRIKAPLIYKTITTAISANEAQKILSDAGFKVDYVVDKDGRRYVAAFAGDVRLIDNVEI